MAYDGRVVFSTKLDNSQIGKQLNELETKIKKSQEKRIQDLIEIRY